MKAQKKTDYYNQSFSVIFCYKSLERILINFRFV